MVRIGGSARDEGAYIVGYTYAAEDAAQALQSLQPSVAAQFQPVSRDSAFEISNVCRVIGATCEHRIILLGPSQTISEPVKKEVPTEHSTMQSDIYSTTCEDSTGLPQL